MDKKFIFIVGGGLVLVIVLIVVIVLLNKKGEDIERPVADNTFIIWDYNNEKAAYDKIMTGFQNENNVKVIYESKPEETYLEDAVNAIAANNGPDIMIVPNEIMPEFRNKLVAMPDGSMANPGMKKDDLESYRDSYIRAISDCNIIDNKIYALPMNVDSLKMFVNKAWFNARLNEYRLANPRGSDDETMQSIIQAGIPTWDDFVTIVKFFTKKNGDKITSPVAAIGTSDNVTQAPDLLTLVMMQYGAQMVSDDLSTALFHTKQNIFSNIDYPGTKALEFYASFADSQSLNYTWNSDQGDPIRAFAEQKTPILFEYSSAKSEIGLISPNLAYAEFNIPQIRETKNIVDYTHFDNLVVPKSTVNADLAWKFVFYATDAIKSINYYIITSKVRPDKGLGTAKYWYNPNTVKFDEIFRTMIKQVNEKKNTQTAMDGAGGQITTLLGKLKQQ